MKRILITGKNSYIGTSFEKWIAQYPDDYSVNTIDMKDDSWRDHDFSQYDVVFHVAGIAHVSSKNSMKNLYLKVNRDLTIDTALKAKESGVKHFIFMSSMIVFSSSDSKITSKTNPNPDNFYGLSKLMAENEIKKFSSNNFIISILRPPMIYGPNSKGNFRNLLIYSSKLFIVPKIENMRSILYVNNLNSFIKIVIDKKIHGTLYPRNNLVVSTNDIISSIRIFKNKTFRESSLLSLPVKILINFVPFIRRVYGNRYYDNSIDELTINVLNLMEYNHTNFQESVGKSID